MDKTRDFYDSWATRQMHDKSRDTVLKWKAVNFLNLLLRNNLNPLDDVCEIGGAEGILLNTLDHVIAIQSLSNYDISSVFCDAGKKLFPKIHFNNYDFIDNPSRHDLALLSDITEHVENDRKFLFTVSKHCKYLLIKIPIEKAFINSAVFYAVRLKKKPEELRYGINHINGHLRGYSICHASKFISEYYQILDHEISDVAYFNPSKKKRLLKRILGKRIFILIYGGAYFALCRSLNA